MKKICGALVIGLMITTNSFAYKDCNDMYDAGFEQGKKKGYDKGWEEGFIAGKSSLPPLGSPTGDREMELEMRLNECNKRNGWKY